MSTLGPAGVRYSANVGHRKYSLCEKHFPFYITIARATIAFLGFTIQYKNILYIVFPPTSSIANQYTPIPVLTTPTYPQTHR